MNRNESGDFFGSIKKWDEFNNTKDIHYSNCIVAIVDIIAYRNLLIEYGKSAPKEIMMIFSESLKFVESAYLHLKYKILSDTLIIYATDDNLISALNIMNVIDIFCLGLLKKGYLTRGAIIKGDHFIKEDVMVSPAFVKAYEYEQNLCIYPRIIIESEIISELDQKSIQNQDGIFGIQDIDSGYFRGIIKENYFTDFDGHKIQSCINSVGSNYLLTYGRSSVDSKTISDYNIAEIVDENIRSLNPVKSGILLAKERAKKPKEIAKVDYLINQFNTIVKNMNYNTRKQELLITSDFV